MHKVKISFQSHRLKSMWFSIVLDWQSNTCLCNCSNKSMRPAFSLIPTIRSVRVKRKFVREFFNWGVWYQKNLYKKFQILSKNSQFVYPVICFLESACGIDAAHQAYALYYALELAATGMNKPLRWVFLLLPLMSHQFNYSCGETDKFDVNVGGSFQRFCPLNSNEKTALNGQSPPY